MRHFLKLSCVERFFSILSVLELCLLLSACASVDTILLTSETFPPKGSADEVAVLEGKPTRPYQDLAELRIGDSGLSFGSLQRKILNRAATLGADAVDLCQTANPDSTRGRGMNRCMIRGATVRTMELRGGMADMVGMAAMVVLLARGARGVAATPAALRFRTMRSRECSREQPSVIRIRQAVAIAGS